MKAFKFGGASVKSADGVKNMVSIINDHRDHKLVVIVSAIDKTTNLLEIIFEKQYTGFDYSNDLSLLEESHKNIGRQLGVKEATIIIDQTIEELTIALSQKYVNYAEEYDQIISFGELLSTGIIFTYLQLQVPEFLYVDARDIIKTDSNFRDAQVDWSLTQSKIEGTLIPILKNNHILTQGFIASDNSGKTTTLGREGSDFTGAILASSLGADSLTVWKDVPGILSGDPKMINNAIKFDDISYEEAAELTYYGAKVIHPKTIKPLANSGIPLFVKPFMYPKDTGTIIHNIHVYKPYPSIIFKENQTLISFRVEDFTFINEHNLNRILHTFTELNIRINLMQNSAISFSVCIDTDDVKLQELIGMLENHFSIFYNNGLQLITIKNYDQQSLDQMSAKREILLEQRSRHNFQIVVRNQTN